MPAAGKKIGYIRVSSFDQKTERQLENIKLDKTFTDKASGKNMQRPQLAAASAALDRFMGLNVQIIGLSRQNTNVRSLALSLDLGRPRISR